MTTPNRRLFHAAHYNIIAKELREQFPTYDPKGSDEWARDTRRENMVRRGVIASIALGLTHRFKDDNDKFDPIRFLDACSPNTDLYPMSELWEDEDEDEDDDE